MSRVPVHILVIDDDRQIRRLLRISIDHEGYFLQEAESGAEGLEIAMAHPPEAFLIEMNLPDTSGLELIRRIRKWTPAPILVITSNDDEAIKVQAFELGADDYVLKPFGVPELVARLRAALRHTNSVRANDGNPNVFEAPGLRIDLENRVITVRDVEIKVSPKEYRLLAVLTKYAGKVLTHSQIINDVWGPAHVGESHNLRVFIHQLRQKIEADPAHPQHIVTEGHIGYRLRRTQQREHLTTPYPHQEP